MAASSDEGCSTRLGKLGMHVKASPDIRVVVRAAASVKRGRVIRVLDILKQAGLTKIAFGVTPAASAAP